MVTVVVAQVVSTIAGTNKTARCINATSTATVVTGTFVDVTAYEAITGVTRLALTSVTSNRIGADGTGIAVVTAGGAFVDVAVGAVDKGALEFVSETFFNICELFNSSICNSFISFHFISTVNIVNIDKVVHC